MKDSLIPPPQYPEILQHFVELFVNGKDAEIPDGLYRELSAWQRFRTPLKLLVGSDPERHLGWVERYIRSDNRARVAFASRATSTGLLKSRDDLYEALREHFLRSDNALEEKAWICAALFNFGALEADKSTQEEILRYYEDTREVQIRLTVQNFKTAEEAVSVLIDRASGPYNPSKRWAYCWFLGAILSDGYEMSGEQKKEARRIIELVAPSESEHRPLISSFMKQFLGDLSEKL